MCVNDLICFFTLVKQSQNVLALQESPVQTSVILPLCGRPIESVLDVTFKQILTKEFHLGISVNDLISFYFNNAGSYACNRRNASSKPL